MTDHNTSDASLQDLEILVRKARELERALETLTAEGYVLVRQEQGEGTND